MRLNYEEALVAIAEAEKAGQQQQQKEIEINVNEMLGNRIGISRLEYDAESKRVARIEEEMKQQKRQQVQVAPPPAERKPDYVSKLKAHANLAKEIETAVIELREAAGKTGKGVEGIIHLSIPKKGKYVLPGLSVQDQVIEMEKIMKLLAANEADENEKRIIRDEIRELQKKIKKDRRQGASGKSQIMELRDKELGDILNMLK